MSKRQAVLFISVPIGSGHVKAAQAIGDEIIRQAPETDIYHANLFDFLQPGLGALIFRTYLNILAYFPKAYGLMYSWGNKSRLATSGGEWVNAFLARRMLKYINRIKPAAIVCTHATPAGLIAYLRKRHVLPASTSVVVTDFVVHRLWVYPEIETYFVATEEMREFLAGFGIATERSYAMGIPVEKSFSDFVARDDVFDKLTLDKNKKTLLLMGGGAGLLPMTDIIKAYEAAGKSIQIIAIAGKNAELYQKLTSLQPRLNNCVLRPLGFVNNVHELMAAADLLISKPGGITSAEALCRRLPLVIYRPIPGQEEANSRYLTGKKVAVSVKTVSELVAAVDKIVDDKAVLNSFRLAAGELARPFATRDIAGVILSKAKVNNNASHPDLTGNSLLVYNDANG